MRELKIYLSGSIKKATNDNRRKLNLWTREHEQKISALLKDSKIVFDNPSENKKRATNNIFREDLDFVESSDIILVDLNCRRGIGVGVELYHAQLHNKVVIAICQANTYYKQSDNSVHPFAKNLCDYIVDNLDDAILLIKKYAKDKLPKKIFLI